MMGILLVLALSLVGGDQPLVYTIEDLRRELKCGRHTALRLANEIGVRLSPRRIVVPRVRLEAWLANGEREAQ